MTYTAQVVIGAQHVAAGAAFWAKRADMTDAAGRNERPPKPDTYDKIF
ncbi:hypothetical protein Z947_3024 [Sulfitobacter geojensis]|nr:hypothetical protein Z947_3024 [Sulfitobacter geojensis]